MLKVFILNNLLFGDTSLFDEKTKKDGIITSSLYVNTLNIDTHFIISLINSCDKYEELINRIDNEFKNINIREDEFERKKKVLISNEIFSYENIDMVNEMIIDNVIFDNKIEMYRTSDKYKINLVFDTLNDTISTYNVFDI